ncbi:MBL fold metallo-hydrolase [Flavobacteriaceae bacterium Ap0902]|nr:MBL fold metallo-hydrolase [Flavobacteriaceae bacterium Ap0902]
MFFQQVYDETLAQASYFIGCQAKGKAMVIDAQRDVDVYLEIAEKNNMKITHVTETHIHADFLSGTRELAAITGAEMYLSDEGGEDWQYQFPHHGLKDGDKIEVGNLTFEVLHTPGHTPESISFLLTDNPASKEPVMIFTGDFVFVGDVGRPDLLEKAAGIMGTKEEGAHQMYQSIERFAALPDYIQVWPGHGAGSACGKALGAVPSSTIGYEKIRNWAFQYPKNESGFVDYLLEGQPEPPKYFAKMKELNKVSRPLLLEVPKHAELTKEEFLKAYQDGVKIIDTRPKTEFAQGFIPNAINIQHNKSLSTWAGWFLNYEEQFILIAKADEMEDLTRKLMRIGLDNIYGYYTDIQNLGLELETEDIIDAAEFETYIGNPNAQIVDIRSQSEYDEFHVEGAEHIFIGDIEDNLDRFNKDKQIVIHCESGDRATIAQSILAKHGFKDVKNYSAGMKQWRELKMTV